MLLKKIENFHVLLLTNTLIFEYSNANEESCNCVSRTYYCPLYFFLIRKILFMSMTSFLESNYFRNDFPDKFLNLNKPINRINLYFYNVTF